MTRTITLAGYAVIAAAFVLLEVVARRTARIPTAVAALEALARHPFIRILILAGWLWLGWHLFARADH